MLESTGVRGSLILLVGERCVAEIIYFTGFGPPTVGAILVWSGHLASLTGVNIVGSLCVKFT